jgi:Zn-finger nucleic acid-binding protein
MQLVFDEGGAAEGEPCGAKCPSCQTELVTGQIVDCKFAGCPDCGGMLFSQPVFANLVRHLRAATNPAALMPKPMNPTELSVHRQCPVCGNPLDTHPYGGPGNAVIDNCFTCNLVWLDHGELSRLVHAPGRR